MFIGAQLGFEMRNSGRSGIKADVFCIAGKVYQIFCGTKARHTIANALGSFWMVVAAAMPMALAARAVV